MRDCTPGSCRTCGSTRHFLQKGEIAPWSGSYCWRMTKVWSPGWLRPCWRQNVRRGPCARRRVAGALRAAGSALSVRGRCSGACGARPGEAIAGNARHSSHQRTLTNKKQAPERSLLRECSGAFGCNSVQHGNVQPEFQRAEPGADVFGDGDHRGGQTAADLAGGG